MEQSTSCHLASRWSQHLGSNLFPHQLASLIITVLTLSLSGEDPSAQTLRNRTRASESTGALCKLSFIVVVVHVYFIFHLSFFHTNYPFCSVGCIPSDYISCSINYDS